MKHSDLLNLVKLTEVMKQTDGSPDIAIGLIDGPVIVSHPDLTYKSIREIPGSAREGYENTQNAAYRHGTSVAGILCAKRNSIAPAICPNCTILIRPIFFETILKDNSRLRTTPEELGRAMRESIEAGARILNLSVALERFSAKRHCQLDDILDYAAKRGVLVVVAAGNQGTVGGTTLTRHPWVIPVVACDLQGYPMYYSNIGNSIAKQGFRAPGDGIISLGIDGKPYILRGTSAAAPIMTGAIALLWSSFPTATAAEIKFFLMQASAERRTMLVPPLLNAWKAYQMMTFSKCHK